MKQQSTKNHWLIVKNKYTYLCLLSISIGVLKLILYDFTFLPHILQVGTEVMISIIIMIVGVYLFLRFNTFSVLFNPDHPHGPDYFSKS